MIFVNKKPRFFTLNLKGSFIEAFHFIFQFLHFYIIYKFGKHIFTYFFFIYLLVRLDFSLKNVYLECLY